jgi:hypothetical protein
MKATRYQLEPSALLSIAPQALLQCASPKWHAVLISRNCVPLVSTLTAMVTMSGRTSCWPGTVLLADSSALAHVFRADASFFNCLRLDGYFQAAAGGRAWHGLEDLTVVREDKSVFFLSITHEKDFELSVREGELPASFLFSNSKTLKQQKSDEQEQFDVFSLDAV